MGNLTTMANGMATDLKNKASESSLEQISHNAGEKIGALAANFANSASGYTKNSRDYVKENPLTGIALAAAAGVLAGSLFTMAMRRR